MPGYRKKVSQYGKKACKRCLQAFLPYIPPGAQWLQYPDIIPLKSVITYPSGNGMCILCCKHSTFPHLRHLK